MLFRSGAATPSGTVTFYNGATPLGTASLYGSNTATLITSSLAIGSNSITAAYGGDIDLMSTTSAALAESLAKAATQIVLIPQPGFKKKKLVSLKFEAEVLRTVPGASFPTGMVTFEIQTTKKKKITEKVFGTAVLNGGAATLTVKPNSVLNKQLKILFAGDSDFAPSAATPPALTQASLKKMARAMVALQGQGHERTRALIADGPAHRA